MAPNKGKEKSPDGGKKVSTLPEAPDGGYGWVIVVAAFLIQLIVDGASFGYGVVSKHIKEYYQVSESEATLVGSLQLGFYLLSCPVSGKLIEKWGFNVVCVTGSLLAAFGFAMAQFSPNIVVLMITYGVIAGIASTLGRATSALLDVRKNLNKILVYNLAVLGAGVACFFNTFSTNYALMVVFSSVFTFLFGVYIALSSVVCCEMLGPEAVNNAFAIMCMLGGLANIVGGPIAGAAYDQLGNYDVCFYIGGAMMTIGGICFFFLLLPSVKRRSYKNKEDPDLVIISMVNILAVREQTTSRIGTYGSVIRDIDAGPVCTIQQYCYHLHG